MRKLLLLSAACMLAFASCQKSTSDSGPYTCTCNYAFVRPYVTGGLYYVADTAVSTLYASGTSFTDAQLYCTNQQSQYKADTTKQNVSCYIH